MADTLVASLVGCRPERPTSPATTITVIPAGGFHEVSSVEVRKANVEKFWADLKKMQLPEALSNDTRRTIAEAVGKFSGALKLDSAEEALNDAVAESIE